MDYLKLLEIIDELKNTSSVLDKKAILKKHEDNEDFKKLLYYCYNTFYKYYISTKNLLKVDKCAETNPYPDLWSLLDALRTRSITGHEAISYTNAFIKEHNVSMLMHLILDRDLGIRVGRTMMNTVYGKTFVPKFEVALAESWDGCYQDGLIASRKLDGVRCIVHYNHGDVTFYSREGNIIDTLDTLGKHIASLLGDRHCYLDGELCLVTDNDVDDFQGIMKQLHKKDHDIVKAKYYAFDYLEPEEFTTCGGSTSYSKRYEKLKTCGYDVILPQRIVENQEHLKDLIDIANKENWEGLILRVDTGYKGKRSKDLLKVKKFVDAEYVVQSIETDYQHVVVNNKETKELVMSKVIINHKDNPVGVGSGWNLEERRMYFRDPSLIIGKIITVQYFEETINEDGKLSLRFPTVKCVYGDERIL